MDFLRNAGLMARNVSTEMLRHFERKRLLVNQFKAYGVNVVIDVGANSGQFGSALRRAGFKSRIVSFEPLSGPFAQLARKSASDPLWECHQYALGDADETITINVAGNAGASSSVLPMLKSHQDAFPPANYIGTEDVAIHRLDSVASEFLNPTDVTFLKIDVQGFEKQVIAGSKSTLNESCVGMQLELSFIPLYEGDMLIHEALELVYSLGFRLTGLLPGFTDPRNGRMLQADGIFFRGDD
ncbi:FkbM family methyltransferase [Mycobacterium avium]|uniref:FkbM family methyltransferase n=1 Tax=Mycobacterium avium TaxID=1764 RepID=UPI000213AD28|nr:FkbM family methyltransferase [Mycobacterium avium]AZP80873.1 FkbM family methyltransferase [Mycobacterium avium subsp. paratuberculosis]QPM71256.1 FkbM family methyltransferase [Mycobacterium avium subsp. paratuberculosis S397]QQK50699.1 FkbM family methyltransferase [Mycobacterium avium subsp. paratuberculosis]WAI52888.1 FkbM family methyltransferase [Mycobacterium avium subsp. paratuberculosis]WPS77853.1 FkbM family methyltransferase [Mycobacterium avium subsp. paratuberculosis]